MDNRRRLWLLLLVFLSIVSPCRVSAQPTASRAGTGEFWIIPENQSHHDLPGGLDDKNAEEMIAQRFQDLQQLHQLQDQVQEMLKDPKLIDDLRHQIGEKQLRDLQEQIRHGDNLRGNPAWNKLLNQAASREKLSGEQIAMLRRLLERSSGNHPSGPDNPSVMDSRSTTNPSSPLPDTSPSESSSASPAQSEEKTLLQRFEEGSEEWLSEHLAGMSDDLLRTLTEMAASEEGAPLAELLRNMKEETKVSANDVAESATGLARYWPRASEFVNERRGLWDDMRSLFRDASAPSLSGLGSGGVPSSVSPPSADGASWSAAALTLATLGIFLLLVWKTGRWARSRKAGAEEDWRLGPWPVAPSAIATRQDLIRAFEYLALLYLGRRASSCNHRELADRLAEQDAGNPARRQAVEVLAWLYEQARYAPAGEVLSPGQLGDARHALCYLAGVTAA